MFQRNVCVPAVMCALAIGAACGRGEPAYPIRAIADGLHVMQLPGSSGKATIVEFADFVALIEVPVHDAGGDAPVLVDHPADGERVCAAIAARFPAKPLRYVLSSHWHAHSLSALAPFLTAGVTLVTTRANYDKLAAMLPGGASAPPPSNVQLVDGDTLEIADRDNRIVAHRFTRKDYPATPTDDYLYFDLPRHDAVHVGCMYAQSRNGPAMGRPVVTAREDDLYRLLEARGLRRTWLIRIDRDAIGERQPFARLARVVQIGVRGPELEAPFRALSTEALVRDAAALAERARVDHLPPAIFNTLAYAAAGAHDLPRAEAFARIQLALRPADANSWDTLGEMLYFAGALGAARVHDVAAHLIEPGFGGGEAVWRVDLEDHRRRWATAAQR